LITNAITSHFYTKKREFRVGNKQIIVYGNPNNDAKIKMGNVKLTEDGYVLYSIVDEEYKKYNRDYVDFIIECLHARSCKTYVNGRPVG